MSKKLHTRITETEEPEVNYNLFDQWVEEGNDPMDLDGFFNFQEKEGFSDDL